MRGGEELVLGWGAVLNSIIVLLATAAVIFYLVRGLRLDKLDKVDRVDKISKK